MSDDVEGMKDRLTKWKDDHLECVCSAGMDCIYHDRTLRELLEITEAALTALDVREREVEEARGRVAELEQRFKHSHVNAQDGTDRCGKCGADLRDTGIHKLWGE